MDPTSASLLTQAAQDLAVCAPDCGAAVEQMAQALIRCFERGGKVLICGNGGSAAEAQHFAAEFVNKLYTLRKALPAIALTTDSSTMTSIGNDISFDEIFSRQVEALGCPADVLWGLSTSGASGNVMKAFDAAKQKGMLCLAFCGRPGSDLEKNADIALTVPLSNTARVQEMHLLAGHIICELVEKNELKA